MNTGREAFGERGRSARVSASSQQEIDLDQNGPWNDNVPPQSGQQFGGELPTAPGDFIAALDFAVHEAQHGFGLPRRFANLEGLWDEMMQIVGGGARGDQTLGGGAQVLAPEGRQRQP